MSFPKFLCLLSGDDYKVINQCSAGIQSGFAFTGFLLLTIFLVCLNGTYAIFAQLFQNTIAGIVLAIFFSWMLVNIYLLILYTLTKSSLPHKDATLRFLSRDWWARVLSIALRALFICFIAVIMSKPLEAFLFSDSLDRDIASYKQMMIDRYSERVSGYLKAREKRIIPGTVDYDLATRESNEVLQSRLIADMQKTMEESNFYAQRIVILSTRYPASWSVTALTVFIFILPALVKAWWLAADSKFSEQKASVEISLVRNEYGKFKMLYYRIIASRMNIQLAPAASELLSTLKTSEEIRDFSQSLRLKYPNAGLIAEAYTDPPFNTKKKIDARVFKTEEKLIERLYVR